MNEIKVFDQQKIFERTYGWAWLLKLQDELVQLPQDGEKGKIQDYEFISIIVSMLTC